MKVYTGMHGKGRISNCLTDFYKRFWVVQQP